MNYNTTITSVIKNCLYNFMIWNYRSFSLS